MIFNFRDGISEYKMLIRCNNLRNNINVANIIPTDSFDGELILCAVKHIKCIVCEDNIISDKTKRDDIRHCLNLIKLSIQLR